MFWPCACSCYYQLWVDELWVEMSWVDDLEVRLNLLSFSLTGEQEGEEEDLQIFNTHHQY